MIVNARWYYKVTDREGLEGGARLEIEFDPSDEDLLLHRVRVLRDGVVHDQLRDTQFQVLQREEDLDDGVVTGRKTVHLEITDVHVGDTIDLAYSWRMRRSLWKGNFFGTVKTSWSVPIGEARYRLIWPAGKPLTIRNLATSVKPTRSDSGHTTTYEWKVEDPDPVPKESGSPSWYPQWGRVALSSMANWADVVNQTLPLYVFDKSLSPDLVARADQIARQYADPNDRITAALRFVQDNLRYVSISIGKGSYVPREPDEVFRSGYGDCKDKAQLLVALLQHMGIEAHTALTDTEEGPSLPDEAPAPTIFDHAIVQVRLGGKSYWLDPTRDHEGGRFPNLAGIDYRWALPIASGQTALEKIAFRQFSDPTYQSTEQYDAPAAGSLTLRVTTKYQDSDADWMRDNIASKSLSTLERDYLAFYEGLYPGIEAAQPIRFTDDRDGNVLLTYETYTLPLAMLRKGKLETKFIVKASSLNDYDDEPNDGRRTPYKLPFPVNRRHTIILITPGHQPTSPSPISVDDPGFRYQLNVDRKGDRLTLDYRLVGKKEVLAPDQIATFRSDVDAVKDDNYWNLDLTSNAGGFFGDNSVTTVDTAKPGTTDIVIRVVAILSIFGVALYGIQQGLHADDGYARDALFFPVNIRKYMIMSAATAGLYSLFWMWKCWRWVKADKKSDILPFWRALFGIFWLYPLYSEINDRGEPSLSARSIAVGAATIYVLWVVGAEILTFAYKQHDVVVIVGSQIGTFLTLPALFSINRLNGAQSQARAFNSKRTSLTMLAIGLGLINWLYILWLPAHIKHFL